MSITKAMRLAPMAPNRLQLDEEFNATDAAIALAIDAGIDPSTINLPEVPDWLATEPEDDEEVGKAFGESKRKKKARQIRNLKRKRKYKKPVPGGRKRSTFGKVNLEHPLVKHSGPGNHPSGSPQSVHGSGGSTPSVSTATAPDTDRRRFAPHGNDMDAVMDKIRGMAWTKEFPDHQVFIQPGMAIGQQGKTMVKFGTKDAFGWGLKRTLNLEVNERAASSLGGGEGPADAILAQARAVEQLYNNPKGRQLWDAFPQYRVTFTDESLVGQLGNGKKLNAVGVHYLRDEEIKIAWAYRRGELGTDAGAQWATRTSDQMAETLAHEFGHAVDAGVGSSYVSREWPVQWTPKPMPFPTRELMPFTGPQAVSHWVSSTWTPNKNGQAYNPPMSQRLLDTWAYPGREKDTAEFFAETVEAWVNNPSVLTDTMTAYNKYASNPEVNTKFSSPVYSVQPTSLLTDMVAERLAEVGEKNQIYKASAPADDTVPQWRIGESVEGMGHAEWLELQAALRGTITKPHPLTKHSGPGNHPSGSSQDVHGSGGGLGPSPKLDKEKYESYWTEVNALREAGKTEESSALFDERMGIERQWTKDARHAMSVGAVTFDEAKALGYRTVGHDHDGWEALPDTLYHVTTAKSAVVADGLKSRDELAQSRGKGLGGGESDTISFTADKHVADSIHTAMIEAQRVASGDITVQDMLDEAKRDGFHDKLMGYWNWEGKPGVPPGVQNLVEGVKRIRGGSSEFPKGVHFVTPANVEEILGAGVTLKPEDESSMKGKWFTAYRPYTPQEAQDQAFDFYKTFASYREYAGGPMNPLFFSTDVAGLAAVPTSQIAVLKYKPSPGAQGYQVSALGEWRTGSGDAVIFEGVGS